MLSEVELIAAGNHDAFKTAYQKYHEQLYFFMLKKSGSSYLAEEMVQQSFTKLWLYRHTLKVELPLSTQLFQIAKTSLIDLLRKKANEQKVLREIDTAANDTSTWSAILEKEINLQVADVLNEMPVVSKKIFLLNRNEGLSYPEIARLLSISPKTVESHISKVLRKLRNALLLLLVLFVLR